MTLCDLAEILRIAIDSLLTRDFKCALIQPVIFMVYKSSSATIHDVAGHTGISVLTVSHNINQDTPTWQVLAELDPQIMPDLHSYSPIPASHPLFPLMNGEPAEQVSLLRTQTTLRRSCGYSDETSVFQMGGETRK